MPEIVAVRAREVLDSRGKPTVEAEVVCRTPAGEVTGRAIAPSGASTGRHEAIELRDGDPRWFDGLGVTRAVANVNEVIAPQLLGKDAADQFAIDELLCELDGTSNKSNLGGNAILATSLACAHAAAAARRVPLFEHIRDLWERASERPLPQITGSGAQVMAQWGPPVLPVPMINMLSGGLHAGKKIEIQDILIIPWGATSMRQCLSWAVTVRKRIGDALRERGLEADLVADEGGYGPALESTDEAFEIVVAGIERAGLEPGRDVALALDIAATHFYRDGHYFVRDLGNQPATADEFISVLRAWTSHFPIVSLEDVCAEDDWDGWEKASLCFGATHQLIGDDLIVTNVERLRQALARRVANAVLVKPNQVGTLTETLEVMALALRAGYRCVISARSGETEDVTIAHLAVGTGAGQIKIGSVTRSERLAKYNELLRIAESVTYPFYGPTLRDELAFV